MCGYCIESGGISDLLASAEGHLHEPRDRTLCIFHLQQAADWRAELASWEGRDHTSLGQIALCRAWSERIAGNFGAPLSEVLDAGAFIELETWLAALDYPPEWQSVLRIDGCPPASLPIAPSKARLDSYIDGWLQRPPAGVMDWDQMTLSEWFLSVSVALDIVSREAPGDERLQVLATHDPSLTPYFGGVDLWLQRRALQACVAHYGVGFIDRNLDKLRVEAILSTVMSNSLNERELREVHAFLQGRSLRRMNLERDDLLEAIQSKLKRIA